MQLQHDLDKISSHLNCKASSPWTWVFYGDSITHGAGCTGGRRTYPEIFAERIRWELRLLHDIVINSAICGQTTVQLLNESQYEWRVRRFKPDAVFVLIGSNDIIKVREASRFHDNLAALTARIRNDGAIPILQTCNPVQKVPENSNYMRRFEAIPEFCGVIRQVAREESTILIDHERNWQLKAPDENSLQNLLGEPIHPGASGHLELAAELFRTLNIFDPDAPCCNPL